MGGFNDAQVGGKGSFQADSVAFPGSLLHAEIRVQTYAEAGIPLVYYVFDSFKKMHFQLPSWVVFDSIFFSALPQESLHCRII
jgi:hypothetical protein